MVIPFPFGIYFAYKLVKHFFTFIYKVYNIIRFPKYNELKLIVYTSLENILIVFDYY